MGESIVGSRVLFVAVRVGLFEHDWALRRAPPSKLCSRRGHGPTSPSRSRSSIQSSRCERSSVRAVTGEEGATFCRAGGGLSSLHGVKITESFEVSRPVDQVWELFQDVPDLASCLPGAELTEDMGDGKFGGAVAVKLGPMTAKFEGEADVTVDTAARTGKVNGKGVDKRGGSQGRIKVDYALEAMEDGGTRVSPDERLETATSGHSLFKFFKLEIGVAAPLG